MGASQNESSRVVDETDGVGGEDRALDAGLVGVFGFARFLWEIGWGVIANKIGAVRHRLHATPVGLHADDLDVLAERVLASRSSAGFAVVATYVAGPHRRVVGIDHF